MQQPLKRAALLASCTISTLHGLTASVACCELLRPHWRDLDVNAPNTREEVGRGGARREEGGPGGAAEAA